MGSGSIQFDQSTVYCEPSDVSKYFRKPDAFGSDGSPTRQEVREFIEEACDQIDEYTRHAWRENTVTEARKNFDGRYRWGAGRPVMLNKMNVRDLDSNKGDKLEVWEGSQWNDWLTDPAKSSGRANNDYWLENDTGKLWVFKRYQWHAGPQLRLTYRYGESSVPNDIRKAAAKLTAMELLESDQYSNLVPGNDAAMSPGEAVQTWNDDLYNRRTGTLEKHKVDPAWVEPY